jgi:hypothetical protein
MQWLKSDGTTLLMKLDGAGVVTINTAGSTNQHSVNGMLRVVGNDAAATNGQLRVYRTTSTATDYIMNGVSDVGGTEQVKWRVEADGDTVSSTGSFTSDERAKKNLQPIKYGLAEILQLQPKSFNWWHEDDSETPSFCISTAQEVQAIMPEMVREDGLAGPDGVQMKAIYDKEIVAVLVQSVKELSAKLDAANARIEALKAA